MVRRVVGIVMGMVLATTVLAQERIDLTTPETKPSNTQYRVERLILESDNPATAGVDEGFITIQLLGQNGESVTCIYNAKSTPTGTTLLTGLNKADLSTAYAGTATTGSLRQRIFHRLVVMGESTARCGKSLVGSLAGTVQ